MQQVIVQVEAKSRMQLKDILNLKVMGSSGQLVSLSEVVTPQWNKAPQQYNRYNGRPSLSIAGIPNFDTSSGEAMREMEQLIAKLPKVLATSGQVFPYRKSSLNHKWPFTWFIHVSGFPCLGCTL